MSLRDKGRCVRATAGILGILLAGLCFAQSSPVTPESEFQKKIKISQDIEPLGEHPFGENISLYNGALSFDQVDVTAAGTGPLIQIARSFRTPDQPPAGVYYDFIDNAFVDWALETPRIETLSAASGTGNLTPPDTASWFFISDTQRCTNADTAPDEYVTFKGTVITYSTDQWWHGYQLIMPGSGGQELLKRDVNNAQVPSMTNSGGATINFPLVTKDRWAIGCLAQTSNGKPGEGFLAVSPDGTRYYLDVLLYKTTDSMIFGGGGALHRRIASMAVSSAVDRFGNTVNYTYDANGNLTNVSASDGRQVQINYETWQNPAKDGSGNYYDPPGYRVHSVVLQPAAAHPRTWTYTYNSDPTVPRLTGVTLPDASAWSFNLGGIAPIPGDGYLISNSGCDYTLRPQDAVSSTASITHPSGLTGTFYLQSTIRGRSAVPYVCLNNGGSYSPRFPAVYKQTSLVKRVLSGPGLATQTWTYSSSSPNDSWSTCTTCATTVTTDMVDPDLRTTRYTFSNKFDASESMLLRTDQYNGDSTTAVLRSHTTAYALPPTSGAWPWPWPQTLGRSPVLAVNSSQMGSLTPVSQSVTTDSGNNFTRQVNSFDAFANPASVTRGSDVAGQTSITETTTYLNDLPHWVLGLPQQVVNNNTGETESLSTYNLGNVTLQSRARFGQTLMSYVFDGSGQLSSFTDPNNHTTHLSNYKHGIPQTIAFPDSTSETLAVDDLGQISSITNQAGNATSYGYDTVGRIQDITYPSGWSPKHFAYNTEGASRGIAAGHWLRKSSQGSSVWTTYFDAMMRPILEFDYRAGDGALQISTRTDYDWRGNKTFQSYPVNGGPDISAITSGVSTYYDGLGRVVQSVQPSELGTLTTSMAYLSGARKQVTDPKGYATTTSYQVFDEPSYNSVIQVRAPESVVQTITRDIYGNPLSIAQGGAGSSVTKTMTYDNYYRLCRTTEPESGSEVMSYDAANNLAWSASGLAITGTGCGQEQVATAAQTTRAYDAMNRVTGIVYPAGTAASAMTYTATGKPLTATSGSVMWTYGYNNLDLINGQTLSVDGYNWAFGFGYDGNGVLASTVYPDGKAVTYQPDAHGRPTSASSYAANATYYPDGDLASFTFGSGAAYSASKNSRNLLSNFSYGSGSTVAVSEDMTYDANANITQITDLTNSGQRTKVLGYDTLNRLTSATASNLWGTESYTYDTLNNIRSLTTGGTTNTYNYDTTNRLASITSGATTVNSFGYDSRGNVTSKNNMPLVFDQANRLTQITGYDTYLYDAEGRRVKKTPASGTPTYYAYSQAGQLLWQYDPSTTNATDYIYLGKKMVASALVDTSALTPSQVNVTLTLLGPPTLSADGTTISVTVDIANHGTAKLTSAGRDPVHMGARIFTTGGQDAVVSIPRTNIPDILPGGHAAVTSTIPASTVIGTGNVIRLVPVQEGIAWFDTWGTVPIEVGPFSACAQTSVYLCNTEYALRGSEVSVALTMVAGPVLSADGQNLLTTVDVQNNGIINISGQGTHPVNLGNHFADAAGNTLTWDIVRAGLPVIAPASHAQVSIATPVSGGVGSGNRIQFELVQEGTHWFRDYGFGPIATSTYGDLTVPGSSTSGAYTVQWTAVPGATSYRLDEQVNGGAWTTVQTANSLSWSTSGRTPASYGYRMAPCGSSGCGAAGATHAIGVSLIPPAPAAISVPATSTGTIAIGWSTASYATSYILEQSFNGGGFAQIYSGANNSYAYTVGATGTYTYRVKACDAVGCSGYSPTGSSSITLPPSAAPSISVPGSSNNGCYTVNWGGVAGATSYTMQEQVNGGSFSTIGNDGSGTLNICGKTNATYGYRVQGCNASGCGPFSGTASVTVALIPAVPTGLSVSQSGPATKKTIHLVWNAASLATSYQLEETQSPGTPTIVYSGTAMTYLTLLQITATVQYRVQACNASGCSAFSGYVTTQIVNGN
ncbi:YD repeat-containing protein [Luteibacter rhizovicinus]|uniref:YD repeat-containing protein n=1 Tax=Luteibacter rhizovicinus TaxID=242606 RepID=A0A4R3Z0F8_9GAMM|nr:RHS repeat protein [Luteibacter rhizovicinus]TCV97688.1 YD repeat-containing protein [Luteibacter rhizovicinus]